MSFNLELLWWNPKSISVSTVSLKRNQIWRSHIEIEAIHWHICWGAVMHLRAAVWLYFSCFNLQLKFTTVSRKALWDDLLLWRNQIFSVRHCRWGVKTDAATLSSARTVRVYAVTYEGTHFSLCGKLIHIGISTIATYVSNGRII